MNSRTYIGVGAVALYMATAMSASALTLQEVTSAAADISAQLGKSLNVQVTGRNETSVTGTSAPKTNATTNVSVGAGVSGDAGANSGSNSTGTSNVSATDEVVVVTRGDIDGDMSNTASLNPSTVLARSDLESFVVAHMQNDERLDHVEARADDVSVTYAQRAYLFGLIPVTVDVTVHVDAQGRVDVSYPWYSFLMTTTEGELETALNSDLSAVIGVDQGNASAEFGAESVAELTAQQQARIIDQIRATMAESFLRAEADAQASASIQ